MRRQTLIRGDTLNSPVLLFYRDVERTMPVDLTGVTARMQVRSRCGAEIYEAVTTVTPLEGRVEFFLDGSITGLFSLGRSYMYDVQLTSPGGNVETFNTTELTVLADYTYGP